MRKQRAENRSTIVTITWRVVKRLAIVDAGVVFCDLELHVLFYVYKSLVLQPSPAF